MLAVNRLREFVAEAVSDIEALNSGKVVVTKEEISRFMRDHEIENNMLLIGIVPEHDIFGTEDDIKTNNDLGFYILTKTDYSEHDHDSFLDIFSDTQLVAFDLVEYIIEKNADRNSAICGLFQNLDKVNFPITPIKGLNGCNGYFIGISFDTAF